MTETARGMRPADLIATGVKAVTPTGERLLNALRTAPYADPMAYSGNCDKCSNSGVGYSYYSCNKCGHEVCNKCFKNFNCQKCTGTYQGPK